MPTLTNVLKCSIKFDLLHQFGTNIKMPLNPCAKDSYFLISKKKGGFNYTLKSNLDSAYYR